MVYKIGDTLPLTIYYVKGDDILHPSLNLLDQNRWYDGDFNKIKTLANIEYYPFKMTVTLECSNGKVYIVDRNSTILQIGNIIGKKSGIQDESIH